METEFLSTYYLLKAMRHNKVPHLIHVSTSEVYGTALAEPMTEDHPLNPQSPYAAAKAGADQLCYAYYVTYGIPVVIVHPFNNYGPNQFPENKFHTSLPVRFTINLFQFTVMDSIRETGSM